MDTTRGHRGFRDALSPLTRNSRRRCVVFYALLLLGGGAGMAFRLEGFKEDQGAAWFVAVAMLVVFGMLRRSTRRLAAADHPELDERDAAARDHAFRVAYALLLVVFAATAVALITVVPGAVQSVHHGSTTSGSLVLNGSGLPGLVLWVFLWAVYLPTAVLAWQEPDAVGLEIDDPALGPRAELLRDTGLAFVLLGAIALSVLGIGLAAGLVVIAALGGLGAFARHSAGEDPVHPLTVGGLGVVMLGGALTVLLAGADVGARGMALAVAGACGGALCLGYAVRRGGRAA